MAGLLVTRLVVAAVAADDLRLESLGLLWRMERGKPSSEYSCEEEEREEFFDPNQFYAPQVRVGYLTLLISIKKIMTFMN
ncbi:MAG: hypothetical protein F6J89_25650 [Symploca sp. SIO1C4]|uniref:Uncharacterized protein n=1 Tax=Symploca sp. SIO1C4 TaxID=2607765 RepID=A0A6B3NKE4_9CYAN|nr:hypothetical protein [Symploca sp. SIO1C4]